jgi:hypothetical protein
MKPRMISASILILSLILVSCSTPTTTEQKTATPFFSPAGGPYTIDQSVTINCATLDATIYYTMDGTEPTVNSSLFTDPIIVSGQGITKTIKAVAIAPGYALSGVGNSAYTISYTAAALLPTFTPEGGTYTIDQSVEISCSTEDTTIYYTMDGSIPTILSTKYSNAIIVAGYGTTKTISAIAKSISTNMSLVATAQYTIAWTYTLIPTPNDGGTTSNSTPLLDWNDISGVSGYEVQIADTIAGVTESIAIPEVASEHQYLSAPTIGGTRYWRVRAKDGTGIWGEWSQIWSFTLSAIGASGPAGGIVFYDKGSYSAGWRFLEVALVDQSTAIVWWNHIFDTSYSFSTGATATSIGSGKLNTATIVFKQGTGSYAASLCDNLVLGGYDDWFLPSKDELNQMYTNLKTAGQGNFSGVSASALYWSSSEQDGTWAWAQNFLNGNKLSSYKGFSTDFYVRAVRAF